MSNEKEIRELVRQYLFDTYADAKIRDEFSGNTNVRNDLFAVNKEDIVSVEIKSDKDSFIRLDKQLTGYLTFSNIVYLAIDKKHYKKYIQKFSEKVYFEKVGLFIFDDGKIELKRKALDFGIPNLYNILMSRQLTYFFNWFKGKSKIKKDYRTSYYLINKLFSKDEIYNISKQIFMNNNRGYECYFEKDLIIDLDKKQKIFTDFTNDKVLQKKVYWGEL
jgi:Holliday junction resolvase